MQIQGEVPRGNDALGDPGRESKRNLEEEREGHFTPRKARTHVLQQKRVEWVRGTE